MNKKIKVAVGMSGGVDSGVAAALLVEKGYEVIGFHCHFWSESDEPGFIKQAAQKWENKCCSTESLEAARQTAYQLDIPFYTIDFRKDFKKQVVDYFIGEYKRGRTPNPCVMCNKFIKFGKLLDYAKSLSCDYLATGHYARIEKRGGEYHLLKAVDETKDQSYFLWTLTQSQLKHILFPIGHLTKDRVRKIASEKKLPVAKRPESFEICFVPGKDYRDFMRRQIPEAIKPGPVMNVKDEIIGEHQGLPLYTIGQRHGFSITKRGLALPFERSVAKSRTTAKNFSTPPSARSTGSGPPRARREAASSGLARRIDSKSYFPPLYVVGVDVKKNALIVGRGAESERKEFEVEEVNWIIPPLFRHPDPEYSGEGSHQDRGGFFANAQNDASCVVIKCEVGIRHQGELLGGKVILDPSTSEESIRPPRRCLARVILDKPVRGITPGQSAVFYRGEEVLGGGIIKS